MTTENHMEIARQIAAQCWCDEETKDRVMDPALCEAVAKRIATWMETAAMHCKNEFFYRNLVHQCAENLGPLREQAFVQDDGGIVDKPLALKVPELVSQIAADALKWKLVNETATAQLPEGVHVGTDPGSQPVELPKTFEHFKYELRDEYHTFDCSQVVFDLIEQHDQASLENWIVPASLKDVHVGTDPVTGEPQFLVEAKIQPQLPSNGFVLKAEDIHDDLQIDCDDYSGDG